MRRRAPQLAARIDAALAGQRRAGTQVMLVGRGSTDPDGNAEVATVVRLLRSTHYPGGLSTPDHIHARHR